MELSKRQIILQEAEYLVRTRGYSAFSFADLADRAAITKASVHYYFPTKEDLITILVHEYLDRFVATLENIKQQHAAPGDRLLSYGQLFSDGFEKGMLPLCGALSAERAALPEMMRQQVCSFFKIHLDWLVEVIEDGVMSGALRTDVSPDRLAMLLLSVLEGGSLIGWAIDQRASVLSGFAMVIRNLEVLTEGQEQRRIVNVDI
ncbi:MAG: TetR/AcrR family transcriptional regulator [Acidiphilium sp.]|nr:TetR/AcrR family transcriptional regulator [Acidiphilium sp.]MDD4936646.1 TetR/AcrR family transcriptional regulator [Acidiphilium sp.]